MDGATLTEALHQRGINVRYLGNVLEFVDKMPAKPQLDHFYVCNKALYSYIIFFCFLVRYLIHFPLLQRIGITELITRCTKHIFKTYLQVSSPGVTFLWILFFFTYFLWSANVSVCVRADCRVSSFRLCLLQWATSWTASWALSQMPWPTCLQMSWSRARKTKRDGTGCLEEETTPPGPAWPQVNCGRTSAQRLGLITILLYSGEELWHLNISLLQ